VGVHLEQDGVQHRLALPIIREGLRTTLALHEELDAPTYAMGLDNAHNRADRVQILGCRVVYILPLGDREQPSIAI